MLGLDEDSQPKHMSDLIYGVLSAREMDDYQRERSGVGVSAFNHAYDTFHLEALVSEVGSNFIFGNIGGHVPDDDTKEFFVRKLEGVVGDAVSVEEFSEGTVVVYGWDVDRYGVIDGAGFGVDDILSSDAGC